MHFIIIFLLLINFLILPRINSKLPRRDLVKEAVDRYYQNREERKKKEK